MSNKTVRLEIKKYVDIDEKIVNAIKILNEKGYTTRYCCSGHPENLDKIKKDKTNMGTYVTFNSDSIFIDNGMPEKWTRPVRVPNGMYRYFTDEEIDNFTPNQLIDLAMKELEEWANNLPENYYAINYNIKTECSIL